MLTKNIEGFLSLFRPALGHYISSKEINTQLVISKLKDKSIDLEQLKALLNSLPPEWTVSSILKKNKELNEIFGISDEEIRNTLVSSQSLVEVKYEVMKVVLLEYAKYASEYYDLLKYSQTSKLAKLKLSNELMMTFGCIKDNGKRIYDSYAKKKATNKNLLAIADHKFSLELLWLRIIYIFLHLEKATDKDLIEYADTLSRERFSISYQKIHSYAYN